MYVDQNCSFNPNDISLEAAASATEAGGFNPGLLNGGFCVAEEAAAAASAAAILEIELQHQQQLAYNNNNNNNWQYQHQHQHQLQHEPSAHHDQLLNLFHHFPTCSPSSSSSSSSLLPCTSSLTFASSPSPSPSVLYDPLLHLNLPPHPPLFHYSHLPGGYASFAALNGGGGGPLFGAGEAGEGEGEEGLYGQLEGGVGGEGVQFENGVLMEFGRERGEKNSGRGTKHFASERHRRDQMRDTYSILRNLIPNPTKNDRASVVGDAIEYIKELGRTVNELKILVEKKRRGREVNKRHKSEDDTVGDGDVESCNIKPEPEQYSDIRSSWLQRKSKDTEVDVRIIEDEVTIKLVQRKKINLLLTASRVLDELQLDLRHIAGGHVGDTYSYLFNTKICEDSSLYAGAIANKLIDVLDRQYAAILPPTTSY